MKEEKPFKPAPEKATIEAVYGIVKSLQTEINGVRSETKAVKSEIQGIRSEMREGQALTDNNFTMLYGMFSDHGKIMNTMSEGMDLMRADIHDIRGNVRFLLGEYSDHGKRITRLEHEVADIQAGTRFG